jgi:DnaK suppressor protein
MRGRPDMISKINKKKKSPDPSTGGTTETHIPKTKMMPYKFEPYQLADSEKYMNEKQLVHFRNILETWKKELMKEVDNTIIEMKEASVTVLADPNDRATQEEAFNLELRTRDRERKLIRKIEEALQQIDDKEYGYCESCGIEIGIRRLEARPTAVLCIDCKTLDEIREKTGQ